jgi:hypothetical protein
MASTVTTPWGKAVVVEEVVLPQAVGDRVFAALVQLLEARDGEKLVRFAYSSGGVARRGPVTLRADDLGRLHESLRGCRGLARVLGLGLR